MVALDTSDYPTRTRQNVYDADMTFILGNNLNSAGTKTTLRAVRDERSPVFQADIYSDRWNIDKPETRAALIDQLVSELCTERFTVFNFAGNREIILEEPVEALLVEVFTKVKAIREGSSGDAPG